MHGSLYLISTVLFLTYRYFGDPVMTEDQIQKCVDSVFELQEDVGLNVEIRYADYIKVIVEHPVVQTFIMGGGTVQYGMGR